MGRQPFNPVHEPLNRRGFLKTMAGVTMAAGLADTGFAAARKAPVAAEGAAAAPAETGKRFKKAVGIGMVKGDLPMVEKFKLLKDLGFGGIELNSPNHYKPEEVIAARDASGLSVHGVVDSVHWKMPFSHPEAEVREKGLEALKTALRDAKAYGATSVLLVPAVVDKETYYDDAYKRSQAEIRKAIPLAEELNVAIAIENVWNNFLLSPIEAARYIDELGSPMVRAYFDVGNVIRSGWPEHWIRILGKRILRIHIKEYSRSKRDNEGMGKGFNVKLLEGDCDWPAVMKALREIGFSGWATAEIPGGDRDALKDTADRMDRIFTS